MHCHKAVSERWLAFRSLLSPEHFCSCFSRFCRSSSISSISGGMEPGISIFSVTTRSTPVEMDTCGFLSAYVSAGQTLLGKANDDLKCHSKQF